MNLGINLGTSKVFFVLAGLFFSVNGWSLEMGGELGHGNVKTFTNELMGVEVQYPDSWKFLDLSSVVSFKERLLNHSGSREILSELVISVERFETVNSADQLLLILMALDSEKNWNEIQVDGKRAFENAGRDAGLIYVFRGPGKVSSIRFKSGETEAAKHEVTTALKSIRLSR